MRRPTQADAARALAHIEAVSLRTARVRAALVRRRTRLIVLSGLIATTVLFTTAPAAHANQVSDWACSVPGASTVCSLISDAGSAAKFLTDPLGYIANEFSAATIGLLGLMLNAMNGSTEPDVTNQGVIQVYAIAFAASSFLTLVLWIIAAVKRAAAGMDPIKALGESVGLLMVSVAVSAFLPAILFYTVAVADDMAQAMFQHAASNTDKLEKSMDQAFKKVDDASGGAVLVILLALFMLLAVGAQWLMLIVRSALILTGMVFGPTVFSGLVDRDLWKHTKRWIGMMGGVIASKYVAFTILALWTSLASNWADDATQWNTEQAFGNLLTALALLMLGSVMPFQLAKYLPLVGDEIQAMHAGRQELSTRFSDLMRKGGSGKSENDLKERSQRSPSGPGDGEGGEGDASDQPDPPSAAQPDSDGGSAPEPSEGSGATSDAAGSAASPGPEDVGSPGGAASTPGPGADAAAGDAAAGPAGSGAGGAAAGGSAAGGVAAGGASAGGGAAAAGGPAGAAVAAAGAAKKAIRHELKRPAQQAGAAVSGSSGDASGEGRWTRPAPEPESGGGEA